MVEATEGLVILPVIAFGVVLGLYELILVHKDENFRGSHWFGHGIHAIGFMIAGLFIVMNTEYFLALTNLGDTIPYITNPLILRILVGLILNIKMHSASALAKGTLASRGMAEHWTHTTIISALVIASPYIWFNLGVQNLTPSWIGGNA